MSIQNIANLSKNDILSTNLINPDLKGRRLKTETQDTVRSLTVRDKILLVEKKGIRVTGSRIENIETANTANELKMILQLFN